MFFIAGIQYPSKVYSSNWHGITRSLLTDEQPYRHIESNFLSRPFPIWRFAAWIDVHAGIWWFRGDLCELPPPHRLQTVTPPVLDNSWKGTLCCCEICDVCIPNNTYTRHGHPIHDPPFQLMSLTVRTYCCSGAINCWWKLVTILGEVVAEAAWEIMTKLMNLPQNVNTGGATSWSGHWI